MAHEYGFDTRSIHAGQPPDPETGARALPIYQTTSFVFEDTQQAADLFALQSFGNIYTRIGNPTNAGFEERIASLEGGLGALSTASGMAAQMLAVLTVCEAGDHVIANRSLYGGTFTQFDVTLRRMGIETTFVDTNDLSAIEEAISDRTRLVYGETVGNPAGDVLDLEPMAELARSYGLPLMVDNTFASPALCRPIEHGADVVVHSATKFIGGHGVAIAGAIVESGTFPWDNGRFPGITEPSPAYHNLNFWDNFREYAFLMKARVELMRDVGAVLSPFNSFLLMLGLETLSLRMERHVANAQAVAEFLDADPRVSWVSYAGLPSHPSHALAAKYMPTGSGAIFTFGVAGGYEAGASFIERVELASHLANVGDAKTLVIHPASTTHQQLPREEREAAGVGDDTIRISIGLENLEDIIWDLDQALGG